MESKIFTAADLGASVRSARRKQRLTQKQLADFFSTFSREFLSDLENGKPTVELDKALTVATSLGLKIYVYDNDEQPDGEAQ
ncbi:MAG: helix-turn-helix domain-containing protein [Coriobacteriales bacterium]|jgi:transcriptional regulator with XRE-family HTH domain|nr:helix-turn-helix domain-containing protein [Coriobacteriales bacterium]